MEALYHLIHTPILFAVVIFGIGSSDFAWAGLDNIPLICAFYLAEMISNATMPSYRLDEGLINILCKLEPNYNPLISVS
jgi:hypothetical protein